MSGRKANKNINDGQVDMENNDSIFSSSMGQN
jgi:hypothetical protein